MNNLNYALSDFIKISESLGLREIDIIHAQEFLKHREYGLCFDTVVTQMYEFEIEIDQIFFDLITSLAKRMNIEPENYDFIEELVCDEFKISQTTHKSIIELINSLKNQ